MFNFIDENESPIPCTSKNVLRTYFFEYNLSESDYYLYRKLQWDIVTTTMYQFKMSDGVTIGIPSNYYVMVGDVYGEVDWVLVDEIIGRDIELLIIKKGFNGWTLDNIEPVGMTEKYKFYWPLTKNPVPIMTDSGDRSVIVSTYDQYKMTRDKSVDEFVC